MNCVQEFTGERDGRGWVKYTCPRCRRKLDWTPDGPEGVRGNAIISPCRGWPFPHEWGHWCSLLLAALGITKPGWALWQAKLGLIEPGTCGGCEARERWLNTLGGRLASSSHWLAKMLTRRLVRRSTFPPPSDS